MGRVHTAGGPIRQLVARIGRTGQAEDEGDIKEIIIVTGPNAEGEATAAYLLRLAA